MIFLHQKNFSFLDIQESKNIDAQTTINKLELALAINEPIPSLIITCLVQVVQFLANVLRYVRYMLSAVRLSVVCDVGAPYSGG